MSKKLIQFMALLSMSFLILFALVNNPSYSSCQGWCEASDTPGSCEHNADCPGSSNPAWKHYTHCADWVFGCSCCTQGG